MDLFLEVTVAGHAGHFDHTAQGHLAPATSDLRLAQGGDQIAGLLLKRLLGRGEGLDLFFNAAVGALPARLKLFDVLFVKLQRLMERLDHVLGLLAEMLGVAPEGVAGESFERVREPGPGFFEQFPLFCQILFSFGALRFRSDPSFTLRGGSGVQAGLCTRPSQEPAHDPADDQADEEKDCFLFHCGFLRTCAPHVCRCATAGLARPCNRP